MMTGRRGAGSIGVDAPAQDVPAAWSFESVTEEAAGGNAFRAALAKQMTARAAAAQAAAAAAVATDTAGVFDYDAWKEEEEAAAGRGGGSSLAKRRTLQTAGMRADAAAPGAPGAPKTSKYISNLLVAAQEREAEREISYERRLARERAAEEAEFGQTEVFVTSAYKEKLLEREQREAARVAADAAADASGSAPTAGGMSGFYRGLLQGSHGFQRDADATQRTVPPTAAPAATLRVQPHDSTSGSSTVGTSAASGAVTGRASRFGPAVGAGGAGSVSVDALIAAARASSEREREDAAAPVSAVAAEGVAVRHASLSPGARWTSEADIEYARVAAIERWKAAYGRSP